MSIPKLATQHRDIFSFSEFWSFGADDRLIGANSASLRDDLEIFKDICDSDDYSIFINASMNAEEINLSDILEYWILRANMELIFLDATIGLNRRRNLQSVIL